MKTYYASPEREDEAKLKEQFSELKALPHLQEFIDALPYPVTVLNSKRQIVFSNKSIIDKLEVKDLSHFLGQRPGEILNCIHAQECEGGCGTSSHCNICGAVNAILKSQSENKTITDDCRIIAENDEGNLFHNFEVTASPFFVKDEQFIIFSLQDNSVLKRKEVLEKIFFHDVLNTAANIQGLSELIISANNPEQQQLFLKLISKVSAELIDEIEGQRQISQAENGKILVKKEKISSIEILDLVVNQFERMKEDLPAISINEDSDDIYFESDKTMISRILKNMLKNAIEASSKSDTIEIGSDNFGDKLNFWVKNPGFMTENTKKQIFQRSYSSKSSNRGFGTYSMKLLGEKYLGGKVSFESSEKEGTVFSFVLNYK